jgi:putative membrane-bound dehydrogenase-like protein
MGIAVRLAALALALASAQDKKKEPAKDQTVPLAEAAARMSLPPGFKVSPFAGEPHVRQPNAMCVDDRGRLWVAENFSYWSPGGPWKPTGRDTILIFEDTDGDGRFDTRKVFIDTLSFVSGLELGFGGVWVGSPPNLLFIPDKDADDRPDGPPQVLLDGWGYQDQHETLNSFIWGPDGWLYGCHGVFTHSRVGKPGTPDAERTVVNAAIWRYHPGRHVFERFAEGTSNPWGVDFDDFGQCFIEACVIPHLWYVIQGARYHRQGGQHSNRYTYDDIKTIADHRHEGIKRRQGGHAHGGLRVVLHDQWPPEWRGRLLIGTIHHHGIYTDAVERKGSGFTGKHVDDFMMSNDPYYLGFNHDFGPDGGLYVIDWYDPRACHGQTLEHRETGRIYKITYGDPKKVPVDLAKLPAAELVKLQLSPNEWYVRHARRLLQERGPDPEVHRALLALLREHPDPTRKLRALWALHATGGAPEALLMGLLRDDHEYVRCWAIQLLAEQKSVSAAARSEFLALAKADPSPAVRLYLAAAMQRLPLEERWETLEVLAGIEQDAGDHNLPLMIWYAVEPLVPANAARAAQLMGKAKIPRLREFITRRMTAGAAAPSGPKAPPAASVPDTALVLRLAPAEAVQQKGWISAWGRAAQSTEGAQPRLSEKVGGRTAVRFNGRSEHLRIAHASELAFKAAESFSISAWAYVGQAPDGSWRGVITKSREAGSWYGLWLDADGRWVFGGQTGNLLGPAWLEGWQHVCAVQEGGKERRLYVNGHLSGKGPVQEGHGEGDLWLGGAAGVKEFFNGSLGEVRLYRRALDPGEVAFLAANP